MTAFHLRQRVGISLPNGDDNHGDDEHDDDDMVMMKIWPSLPKSLLHLAVLHGVTQFVSKVNKNLKQFFTKMENIKISIFPVLSNRI